MRAIASLSVSFLPCHQSESKPVSGSHASKILALFGSTQRSIYPANSRSNSRGGESLERKSNVCGITGPLSATVDLLPTISSTPASAGRLPSLSKRKICNRIFSSLKAKLTNSKIFPRIPSSHCSWVQEKLVRYDSEAPDTVEHLGLIVVRAKRGRRGSDRATAAPGIRDVPIRMAWKSKRRVSSVTW